MEAAEQYTKIYHFEDLNLNLAVLPAESQVWTSVRQFGKILSVAKDCVFYSYNGKIYIDKNHID